MKNKLSMLVLASCLLFSGLASATTATYQFCSTAGCINGGSATVTSTYAKTKYPIILAHGLAGFTSFAGIEYFYGISSDLTSNGASVFDTQVALLNSSYVRGEQLLSQVKQILAITGTDKVNLIGYSQGALDSRYVAGLIPNQVASVTSVGGVNFGSPVADTVAQIVEIPGVATTSSTLGNAIFSLMGVALGHYYDQDSLAALNTLTTEGTTSFNAQFPAGLPTEQCGQGEATANGVSYFSWGGIGVVTNLFNPLDYLFAFTSILVPGASDGVVPQCSSHLGMVVRDNYDQNHGDEVNQVFGLTSIFEVSPVTLYRNQANRLKNTGL